MIRSHTNKIRALFQIVTLASFLALSACTNQFPAITTPAVQPPAAKMTVQPRVVLVLGAGGARGYAHLGVLQALEEAHIPVDVVIGSSAGSIVAVLYADNSSFQKTYNIMMPAGFWDYADLGNLGHGNGIIKGYRLENFLLNHMKARTFEQLHTKVIVATTDMASGTTYAIQSGPIAPAVLASAAIPGAIRPVNIYGHTLVDGGVMDPVAVDLAEQLHPKVIIAVNITPKYQESHSCTVFGITRCTYRMMAQRINEDSLKGADVVITPDVGNTGAFAIQKKRQMYLAGLAAARKEVPHIRQLLGMNSAG